MGEFRITIDAVGSHGCERDKGEGERVFGCASMRCPDCLTARFVSDMQRAGASITKASLQHWPGTRGEVRDDYDAAQHPTLMLTPRVRRGDFPKT